MSPSVRYRKTGDPVFVVARLFVGCCCSATTPPRIRFSVSSAPCKPYLRWQQAESNSTLNGGHLESGGGAPNVSVLSFRCFCGPSLFSVSCALSCVCAASETADGRSRNVNLTSLTRSSYRVYIDGGDREGKPLRFLSFFLLIDKRDASFVRLEGPTLIVRREVVARV